MGRSHLACPECGTQYHGSRDVCPFCHAHIHQIGGHACHECGEYIPTVAELRAAERAARNAEIAEEQRPLVERTLRATIPSLVQPMAFERAHG